MAIARALLITAVLLLAIGAVAANTSPACLPVAISSHPGVQPPIVLRCYVSIQGAAPAALFGGAALLLLGLWRAWVSR